MTLVMRSPLTAPGKMALTRIFCGPNSIAKDFTNPTMAHFVDE